MKKARIIYNPSSGREKVRKYLPYILERLEKAGYEASAHATTGEGCAKKAASLAAENNFDIIIAAGGDGTIFEVVNGLAEKENRPTLGIIPAGTTNDFARALGIPRNIKKACDILCNNFTAQVDIGKAGENYFVNVAAGGALTELTYEVPSKLKTVIGWGAYLVRGIRKLPYIKSTKVHIEYDGKSYSGEIMLFLVCNTKSVGGFEQLAPKSEYNDGLFDLIIAEKMSFHKLFGLGVKTLTGKHLKNAKVIYAQAKNIKIETLKDMPINLDGEYGGRLPTEFKNLHNHFRILTPKKD